MKSKKQKKNRRKTVSTRKKALITGITGQDGSYLAEFLLYKDYEVHGLIRRSSTFNTGRIDHLYQDPHIPGIRLFLHYGDLSDAGQLTNIIYNIKPDEIYHLGAQSHVRVSFDLPECTGDITGLGTTRILEAIRCSGNKTRFYQASSSEMFGAVAPPQNENTPFMPRSPYAAAKAYSYWMVKNYREGYNASSCIKWLNFKRPFLAHFITTIYNPLRDLIDDIPELEEGRPLETGIRKAAPGKVQIEQRCFFGDDIFVKP